MNDSVRRGFKDRIARLDSMRVVVVMPARNEAELISSSIASVPSSVDWIVVVDDGSTDNTAEVARKIVRSRGEVVSTGGLGVGGTLLGAILGAVFINYAKSLVSEALPASWMFIQGGLFILVVTALPEGVLGWVQGEGPRNLLQRFGLKRKIETYPSLEIKNDTEELKK